jgi:hypothetical protein
MSEPRLAAEFWVQAYRKRLAIYGIPAFVTAHGDNTSGAVLVKLNTLNGKARAFMRRFDLMSDTRRWDILAEGLQDDVDASIKKQKSFDPDLWVIEVEDKDGRHLLDEEGLG